MPKYRKFHVKAVESLDINDMPDDFHRLLWVMLPLGLDAAGRGLDNTSWIKAKVMPLREDVTTDMIDTAMVWYEQRMMIYRYEVDGRKYFCIPTWHKYQGDTSREAPSNFPEPIQDNSRVSQELVESSSSRTASTCASVNESVFEDLPKPSYQLSAEAVLNRVTGWAAFPGTQQHYKHTVDIMIDTFGAEKTIEAMTNHFSAWSSSRTKDGKPYNKLNLTWIDKAQAELAEKPADLSNVNFTELTPEQRDEYIKQKYGELEG